MALIGGVSTSDQFAGTLLTKAKEPQTESLGRDDFFKLLIAELKNQDPLRPKDDSAFLAELAQFTSLQEIRNLADVQNKMLAFQATTQSAALIGRYVDALVTHPNTGEEFLVSGLVTEVRVDTLPPRLIVGGVEVDSSSVLRVY